MATAGDVVTGLCVVCGQEFEYVVPGRGGRRRLLCSDECRKQREKYLSAGFRERAKEEMNAKYRERYADMRSAGRGHTYTRLSVGVAQRGFREAIAAILRRVSWDVATVAEIKEIVTGLEYGEDFPHAKARSDEPEVRTGR